VLRGFKFSHELCGPLPRGAALAPLPPNRIVVAHDGDAGGQALLRAAAVLLVRRVQCDAVHRWIQLSPKSNS
jgi:hypothetical protein